MDWIVIDGVKPYDGRYLFDLAGAEPTTREWGWIKRLSGYMPATIQDGFDGFDPELFSAFAVIALRRAGKIDNDEVTGVFERIVDAPFAATIRVENDGDRAEDDAGPPAPSSPVNGSSSGPASRTSSARSATASPSGSGTPASATSVSLPAGSAT
jgi:hypothetical protein